MPVTKHKAASCRKFNVVAPRGRDKRGESFSRLSTVANFVARLARKSSLRDCKRKIQVDSAGVGKSAAGQIHVEATWRVAKPLKSTKSKILFFSSFLFFLSFLFHSLFRRRSTFSGCIRTYRCLSRISSAMLCFVFSRFVSLQPRIQWRIFTSISNYPRTKGDRERGKIQFLKFFKIQILDVNGTRCWHRFFERE